MSKTSQRKRDAYAFGYRVGRYGWPNGVKLYRVSSRGVDAAWRAGFRDGCQDRFAAERLERSVWSRLVAWLRRMFGSKT